ncbi:hypothetical protein ABTY20_22860 [Streptomyces sp. NPDC126497]|uniref:hypothetical protein n=1 Tax=Streptomyces sp. NPDC126497 TaxID=3155313 RepID=UPI0033252E0F
MQISRQDITVAAENIDLYEDDYSIRESYAGRYGVTGAGVVLAGSDVTPFMVALAVHLAEDGRGEDALSLGRKARTDSMGTGTIVYWGGVEIVA